MKYNTKFLLCFLVLTLFLSLSYAQETVKKPTEIDLISDKAKESTVRIVGFSRRGADLGLSGGTGFFIAPDKIATNFHVAAIITGGPITAKLSHKKTIWLVESVVAFDIEADIAILKVKGEGVPLPLGDSDTLQIGEPVFHVGFPSSESRYKVTEGVVEKIRKNDKRFQTSAEVYPGNSGGPVLNSKGQVIGIHYGHDPGNSPVNAIKALLAGSTSTEPLDQWRKRKAVRAYAYYMQGWHQYYGGNAEEGIKDFNKAIELNPDDTEIYKIRGEAKSTLGDYKGAIDDYNHVLKLNPDDLELRKKLEDIKKKLEGQSRLEVQSRKDGTVVRKTITRTFVESEPSSIESEPSSGDVINYKQRGYEKSAKGDYAGAIEDFTQAIKLKPNDAYGYKNRAAAKEALKDHIGAIEDYTQAIKLKPDDANAYNQRGWAKRKLDDHAGALEDFTQVIKLKPDDAQAFQNRASVKEILGDLRGVIDDFTYAIKLKPHAYAYMKRAEAKQKLGDYAGAIEDYNKLMKIEPGFAYYCINSRGLVKRDLGDHAGALEDFTQAIKLKPDEPYAYRSRGLTKVDMGDYTGAIEDYNQAIKVSNTDDPFGAYFAYKDRGNAKHKLGDYDGAIEDYNQAIKIKPEQAPAYNDRGQTKAALKDYDGAIADYDKAIELNPKYAIAYHNRGLAKEALGQHEAAEVDFEKAKEIDPEVGK